ncbi:MAG: TonB-dependent receptor plug domain-containing protein, partial [Candidatus Binatia bacterium]
MIGALLVALSLLGAASLAAADEAPAEEPAGRGQHELQTIEVFGKAPSRQPLDRTPLNVQVFDARDLDRLAAPSVTDALGRGAGGVYLAQSQDNPFQPDLTYRGFVSSSLLGAAQGLSVFQDGAR